jgi:hypothetical protein
MKYLIIKARNIILGFCLLLFISLIPSSVHADNINNPKFVLYPSDDPFADSAMYYLDSFELAISHFLNFELDTTVTVYIANSESEFENLVGDKFPDWGAGAASLRDASIFIKSPKYIRTGKSFSELLGHELTHIMLYRAAGRQWLPRWIHEGLSMKLSGEWSFGQDILVARAAWTNNLIELLRLEQLSAFNGAEANLAYTESYLAVSSLATRSDPYILSDILEAYRETKDFRKSFKMMVGVDYLTWADKWLERTSMQYHFLLFIFDSKLFWIMVPILFIFLFLMKKRQNMKTKKRWRREERFNPPDDSYDQYYDGYYDDKDQV